MTFHARDFARQPCVGLQMLGVTAFTSHSGAIHHVGHRLDSLATDTGIEIALSRMTSQMTRRAFGSGRFEMTRCHVLDLEVAVGALDLVVGHVDAVEKNNFLVRLKALRFVMTGHAPFLRHCSRTRLRRRMAGLAFHPETGDVTMVEIKPSSVNHIIGNLVTERAPGGAGSGLLILEVTQDAGRRRNRNMATLDDLRMTGRATQLLPAAKLRQMRGVIEQDVPKHLFSSEKPSFVALEAGRILDLRPGIGTVGPREIASHHRDRLVFLSNLGSDSRGNVALDTSNPGMTRGAPGLVVGRHHVAGATKLRRRADLDRAEDTDQSETEKQSSNETELGEAAQLHGFFLSRLSRRLSTQKIDRVIST